MKRKGRPAQLTGDIKAKLLAGRAVITLVNALTGTRNTFKIWYKKDYSVWYVFHRTVNEYTYIGALKYSTPTFATTAKSVSYKDQRFIVFNWFWNKVVLTGRGVPNLQVWHEGTCCKCGRNLITPESIFNGIGPVCAKMISGE